MERAVSGRNGGGSATVEGQVVAGAHNAPTVAAYYRRTTAPRMDYGHPQRIRLLCVSW